MGKKELKQEELDKVSGGIGFTFDYAPKMNTHWQTYPNKIDYEQLVKGQDYYFFKNNDEWFVGTVIEKSGRKDPYRGWCITIEIIEGEVIGNHYDRGTWNIDEVFGLEAYSK